MNILEFFQKTRLDDLLLLGFYGGGNYGDELLLEVMQEIVTREEYLDVRIYYQNPEFFSKFHKNHGYEVIDARNPLNLLLSMFKSKHIVIGGGGLWGMDANFNILLLGVLLLISKLAGKRVYLIGVGYYNSTNFFGRLSAWLTGLSAKKIFARDQETYHNFLEINPHTYFDQDLALYIPELKILDSVITTELPLEMRGQKKIIITLRRFGDSRGVDYLSSVEKLINSNSDRKFILLLCEPRSNDPIGFETIRRLGAMPHVVYYDFDFNPIALISFFEKHHSHIALIAPQYHMIITALITKTKFFPVVYDNKVKQLLVQSKVANTTDIHALQYEQLQEFANEFYQKG